MQVDGSFDDDKIIGSLAGAIHDGLHHGNWLWEVIRK
jgi:hypothetical protein